MRFGKWSFRTNTCRSQATILSESSLPFARENTTSEPPPTGIIGPSTVAPVSTPPTKFWVTYHLPHLAFGLNRSDVLRMSTILKTMMEQQTWVVIGSIGRIPLCESLVAKLRGQGKTVHSLNPRDGGIAALSTLDPVPDVVNLIVNPKLGPDVVNAMGEHKIGKHLFVQPGAEFEGMTDLCQELGISLYEGCVLRDS